MVSITAITLLILSTYNALPIESSNLGSPEGLFEAVKPMLRAATKQSVPLSELSLSGIQTDKINPVSKVSNALAMAAVKKYMDWYGGGNSSNGGLHRRAVHSNLPAVSSKPAGPLVRLRQADSDKQRRDWNDGNGYYNDYY